MSGQRDGVVGMSFANPSVVPEVVQLSPGSLQSSS